MTSQKPLQMHLHRNLVNKVSSTQKVNKYAGDMCVFRICKLSHGNKHDNIYGLITITWIIFLRGLLYLLALDLIVIFDNGKQHPKNRPQMYVLS